MTARLQASELAPALATAVGSLPHHDPSAAARVVLRAHPRLPAAPQLPARSPLEGMVAQCASALPEVTVAADGSVTVDGSSDAPPIPHFDDAAHGGLLAFLEVAANMAAPPRRVKLQVAGPLTLGLALTKAGMTRRRAFRRAAETARAWAVALEDLVARRLPSAALVLFFDEPGLVAWRQPNPPLDYESAVDVLSGALAATGCTTGVHVCGAGDRRLALEAGPQVLGVEIRADVLDDADVIARHLDADGWVAWGAVPTDRPVGESVEPHWRGLVNVWCELTRRGCDPSRLRTQGLLTPACGLAGHGPTQAEHTLRLTRELADRVHDQAIAARLTLGA